MDLFKLLGTIAIDNSDANRQIDDTTGKASDSSGKMSSAFKKVGAAIATYLTVDAIKNFGLGCIQAAADAGAMESQFSQVFGDLEKNASKSLSGIAKEAGISENRMKGSFTKIAAFAKTTGMDTEEALGLSERAMVAVADSAAFYDRSLEETTESLQSFLKGNYENDAALGLSCTETTRNAAANALYGKSFKDLSESQKQLTLLQMVEDANKTSGALGQAARESDTWTNVLGNLKQSWTDFQAKLGEKALPVAVEIVKKMVGAVQGLTDKVPLLVEKFNAFKERASEVGGYIGDKLKPIFDDMKAAFDAVKDALQPIIDKFSEYVSSGEAAEDITDAIKAGVDLLADAYEVAKELLEGVVSGFKDAVTWGKEHETGVYMIATAVGTLTAAITAYNIAAAIKKAGGIAEIAQLGILQVQIWALTAAETAHTAVTTIGTAVMSAFGAVMAFVTSPITLVIVAIGALIAIGVLLYKNWDTIKEKCAEVAGKVKEKWNDLKQKTSEAWNNIKQKTSEAWSNVKSKVSESANAAKDKVSTAWNNLKTKTSETFENVKTKASETFGSIKTTISDKVTGAYSTVKEKFDSIKKKISDVMESAKKTVSDAVQKLKEKFNFSWSLPKIKLPHFHVSGGKAPWGFMGKGSLPSVSVEWYKKAYDNAMLLDEPTIFGYSAASGNFLGGGDGNGSEVVAGANTLMNMIQNAVATQNEAVVYYLQKLIEILANFFPQVLEGMERDFVWNDGVVAARLAPAMDLELGRIKERKGRGR